MRRFTHLTLRNWRNFGTVSVDLQERVILVGPNASGKSNFLDAFRFLSDLVAIGGGFQEAVRKRGGISKLRYLNARASSDITIEAHVNDDDEAQSDWVYRLTFNQNKQQRPSIKEEFVSKGEKTILRRSSSSEMNDPERLTQTDLEQVYANQEFREIVTFFSSVRYLHIVPQLMRDADRSVGRKNDPFGGDFLEQLARTPERTRTARLNRISETMKIAVPQLEKLDFYIDAGKPHLRAHYIHWRLTAALMNEEHLSDGTLRLMGLLWSILDGNGPLLLEEPELSLHPAIVRHLPQMFARVQNKARYARQILLSSHSADLLMDDGLGLNETLLLTPQKEGTAVKLASDIEQISALVMGGASLADAVIPLTSPPNPEQLSLFVNDL